MSETGAKHLTWIWWGP